MALLGMRHLALRVRDAQASKRFYCDLFGMRVVWEPDPDNVYLSSGTDNLALHRQAAPGAGALDHLGFIVDGKEEVDRLAASFRAQGVPISAPPRDHRDGSRSFYCTDPDGLSVQVLYEPTLSAQVPRPPAIERSIDGAPRSSHTPAISRRLTKEGAMANEWNSPPPPPPFGGGTAGAASSETPAAPATPPATGTGGGATGGGAAGGGTAGGGRRAGGSRKAAPKGGARKKTAARKGGARKKAAARKGGARKKAARKAGGRKKAARKSGGRKKAARRSGGARKGTARKAAARRAGGRKKAARRGARRR